MTKDYWWVLRGPDDQDRGLESGANTTSVAQDADEVRLFARGHESIRITIRAATKSLHVFGPGRVQKQHEFATASDLAEFLQAYEKSVVESGWALLNVSDRRVAGRS